MSIEAQTAPIDWNNPSHMPMSNGPIRTITGPIQPKYALDSDRSEMEYLLSFPFHVVDRLAWPPITFLLGGIPITLYKPIGTIATHATSIQMGNEEADAYCTVIRLSRPTQFELSADDGWKIVNRLLEWIRIKCRHYWLLHGINGFGATYRGSLFTRKGNQISQQNIATYGPNVIVNPLTRQMWETMTKELESNLEAPIEDALYCDSLLSIVAGDSTKALLEAGVAMEVALTKLLVDVSTSLPHTPAKNKFIRVEGDRNPFGKKLTEWTKSLGLQPIEQNPPAHLPQDWHIRVKELYKLRNGVAHSGKNPTVASTSVVQHMFAAAALLEYCRSERLRLGLATYSMPSGVTPSQQIRFCHDANISTSCNPVTYNLS